MFDGSCRDCQDLLDFCLVAQLSREANLPGPALPTSLRARGQTPCLQLKCPWISWISWKPIHHILLIVASAAAKSSTGLIKAHSFVYASLLKTSINLPPKTQSLGSMKPINRHTSSDPIKCLPVIISKIEPVCLRQPDWKTLISTYTQKNELTPTWRTSSFQTWFWNVSYSLQCSKSNNEPYKCKPSPISPEISGIKIVKTQPQMGFPLGCGNYRGRIVCGADWRCSHADTNSAWAGLGLPWVIGDRKQNEATEW